MANTAKNLYECIFIARQDVPAADVNKLTEKFSEIFKTNGGSVEKTEYWGLRSLAYEVKKNRKGHYVYLIVQANSDSLSEFERQCKINEDVLKFMTLTTDSVEKGPSIMMQAPEESSSNSNKK
ncbi:UNVERIFIED_CONTAM: hypothetical protein GTU68_009474 [Idotea baltica]|nr:hypothetical protein [Idotea baltica]